MSGMKQFWFYPFCAIRIRFAQTGRTSDVAGLVDATAGLAIEAAEEQISTCPVRAGIVRVPQTAERG
jgi:hypothetical protein